MSPGAIAPSGTILVTAARAGSPFVAAAAGVNIVHITTWPDSGVTNS